MADDQEAKPGAEDTAQRHPPCRYCGGPVTPARRPHIVKDFCCDRHRAAFRDARVRQTIQDVIDLAEDLAADLTRKAALLRAAVATLASVKTKPRQPRGAVQPDPALTALVHPTQPNGQPWTEQAFNSADIGTGKKVLDTGKAQE